MTETFAPNSKNKRKSVVLVEYPRKGSWAVGFATKDNKGEITKKTKEQLVNVFVPTTPNPTSGFMLIIKKNNAIESNMSVEEGLKTIISGGMVSPEINDIK